MSHSPLDQDVRIESNGLVRFVYTESIDLGSVGSPAIRRAGHVEPTSTGGWLADLAPVGGPCLGPFPRRSTALAAEQDWLRRHWPPAR